MMWMEMIRLGDACEILNGFAFKSQNYVDSGIRIIRISNVQKGFIEDNTPAFYSLDSSGLDKYMLNEGDLLMSLTGNVGRVAILEKEFLPAALNQRVACIRLKIDKLSKGYLFHILNSDFFEQQCIRSSKGVAQKNMSTEWLKEYEIPVYSKEKQEAITEILDKVRKIITCRNQEIKKMDDLIKARFVELFGDIVLNPLGHKEATVVEYCQMTQGTQIPMSEQISEYQEGYYRYLYIRDLKYDDDNWIYVLDQYDEKKLTENDLVVVNTGNTAGEIYRGKDGILSNNLFKVSFDSGILSTTYMFYYFRSEAFQNMLWSEMKEGTQPHLGHKIFGSKKLLIPPIEIQNEFEAFVNQVDKSKVVVQNELNKAQLLFDSLMQSYFG